MFTTTTPTRASASERLISWGSPRLSPTPGIITSASRLPGMGGGAPTGAYTSRKTWPACEVIVLVVCVKGSPAAISTPGCVAESTLGSSSAPRITARPAGTTERKKPSRKSSASTTRDDHLPHCRLRRGRFGGASRGMTATLAAAGFALVRKSPAAAGAPSWGVGEFCSLSVILGLRVGARGFHPSRKLRLKRGIALIVVARTPIGRLSTFLCNRASAVDSKGYTGTRKAFLGWNL